MGAAAGGLRLWELAALQLRHACSARASSRLAPPASPSLPLLQGRRLFVFIVGGVTPSEMRCAHRLSARLGRDVFVGGTSVETPARFLRHVADLSAAPEHLALEVDGGGGGGGGGGGFFRFS